jgi:predicted nucleic acid-binding protein
VKRVVADTNVLVSAIQFGGKPKYLLDLAVDGQVDLALSEAILDETLRVLRDKFHRTADELSGRAANRIEGESGGDAERR